MIVVAHRRNTFEQLAATPRDLGVEVDVRARDGRLVVAHDPFDDGPPLADWLALYAHRLLVVNTKEEGLGALVLPLLAAHGIEDFFLLGPDPGEARGLLGPAAGRVAVRVSEVHHPGTAHALAGRARWVWLDAFEDGFPVSAEVARGLVDVGYRICLVSPELYGRDPATAASFHAAALATGVAFDAVCTRQWDAWSAWAASARRSADAGGAGT